jgi:polyhydroxybutyrate depolymerase
LDHRLGQVGSEMDCQLLSKSPFFASPKAPLWTAVIAVYFGLSGPLFANCAVVKESCQIATGSYEIELPKIVDDQIPTVIFLHGYGGTGMGSLQNESMKQPLLDGGYAVIAPNALMRTEGQRTSWNFHPESRSGRDEIAFLSDVIDDAVARFHLDRKRVLLAGFSIGGSMTSYVACKEPKLFAAYAPVSGSFWRPHPTSCAGPVRLLHTHGWTDKTVPLEGRRVGSGITQGDVFYAMNIWRETNLCDQPAPNNFKQTGIFLRRNWTDCAPDSALEFALFPGGHTVPKGWAAMVVDWFEARVP